MVVNSFYPSLQCGLQILVADDLDLPFPPAPGGCERSGNVRRRCQNQGMAGAVGALVDDYTVVYHNPAASVSGSPLLVSVFRVFTTEPIRALDPSAMSPQIMSGRR